MSFYSQESFFVTLCWYKHVSLFSFSAVLVVDLSLLQPLTYLLDEHPLIILRLLFKYLFCPTIKNEFIFPTVELHYGLQGPEMSVSQIAYFHTTPWKFFCTHALNKVQTLSLERSPLHALNKHHIGDIMEVAEWH